MSKSNAITYRRSVFAAARSAVGDLLRALPQRTGRPRLVSALTAALGAALLALATTAVAAVQLAPVISSGLSSPLFVTHAGDHSNRLFIVERGGVLRVRQAGGSTAAVFLDIRGKVLAGNEQGLLGLAFHPAFAANGRFFVYYTRRGDGAIVIAEYHVSSDPDVAQPTETVLLTIPHPGQANHNGGMLAFGPDGLLYMGVGDGGSANDPPRNAQNLSVLLGKILRIDVDHADTGRSYAIPPDNPFAAGAGRGEIYAYGLRNPWRFSFDRVTGRQWVGDVGQDAKEEVDTPIVKGGNYGWRVYEGFDCTNNDPALCNPQTFIAPLFDYGHTGGRCSITGGYVYRGPRGTLPPGTYVYADYCTGEIFAWDGSRQSLLLASGGNIVSFGEDEQGELYAVDIGGSVKALVSDSAPTSAVAVEFFHAGFGHYFSTTSADEIAKLDAGVLEGWTRTGESFNVYPLGSAGQANMCRFFSTSFGAKSSHFYTPLASECAMVKQNPDWQFEGEVFSVALPDASVGCSADTVPLYRLYNNGQGEAPNHRYTTRAATRTAMLARGWISEGNGDLGVVACVPR